MCYLGKKHGLILVKTKNESEKHYSLYEEGEIIKNFTADQVKLILQDKLDYT